MRGRASPETEDLALFVWLQPDDGHAKQHRVPAVIHCDDDCFIICKAWWFGKVLMFAPQERHGDFSKSESARSDIAVQTYEGDKWSATMTLEIVPMDRWLDSSHL